jgi:hypothetical protein
MLHEDYVLEMEQAALEAELAEAERKVERIKEQLEELGWSED